MQQTVCWAEAAGGRKMVSGEVWEWSSPRIFITKTPWLQTAVLLAVLLCWINTYHNFLFIQNFSDSVIVCFGYLSSHTFPFSLVTFGTPILQHWMWHLLQQQSNWKVKNLVQKFELFVLSYVWTEEFAMKYTNINNCTILKLFYWQQCNECQWL